MQQRTILITGGAGYIGSHVNKMLIQAGYRTVILDNLSRGSQKVLPPSQDFVEGSCGDVSILQTLFQRFNFHAVMHFAAYIDVGESVNDPAKYYQNNVVETFTLLKSLVQHKIKTFVFSSSAAIFGYPEKVPIKENHPCKPINPYGESKLMVEKILRDFDAAYGLKSCCLRYFNAAGGDPEGIIKNYQKKSSNLIPIVLRSLLSDTGVVTINGTDYPTPDGTCVRDYIHIEDLGAAHILGMERLFAGLPSSQYNLGNGQGYSIREVIQAAEKVTGIPVRVQEGPRRPGDPPLLVADSTKARSELGWNPRYPSLEIMLDHAWRALHP